MQVVAVGLGLLEGERHKALAVGCAGLHSSSAYRLVAGYRVISAHDKLVDVVGPLHPDPLLSRFGRGWPQGIWFSVQTSFGFGQGASRLLFQSNELVLAGRLMGLRVYSLKWRSKGLVWAIVLGSEVGWPSAQ